jgi:transposase-like protein
MKALEGQFMDVFTPPPYREARPHGRPSKLTPEARYAVAQAVTSKEMTYREAAKAYGISPGAVGSCVRLHKKGGAKAKVNAIIKLQMNIAIRPKSKSLNKKLQTCTYRYRF